jgi:hypothetical protein
MACEACVLLAKAKPESCRKSPIHPAIDDASPRSTLQEEQPRRRSEFAWGVKPDQCW